MKLKFKSEYIKNILTLMTGTAIAQAIPVAISPILTRMYSPEDFGVFALYLSLTSILSVVVTGRYEFAITLPSEDSDAIQILFLSSSLTVFFSIIIFLTIVIFNNEIISLLGNPKIGNWLYFVPFTILISGVYQGMNFWFNRKKQYNNLAKSRVIQTVTTGSLNLSIGAFQKGSVGGLIFGNILGQLFSTIFLVWRSVIGDFFNIRLSKKRIFYLAKRYRNFPKYDVLASLFNISSNQISHVYFNVFFNSVTSGYYFLVQKIFSIPITLMAGAIQDVFKMEIIEIYNAKGNTRKLYVNTMKKLILLAVLPTILIYFYSIDVFVFVFGEKWRPAGEFVKIMTPIFFLRFVSFPLSYMIYVAEKQSFNIIGQLLLLIGISLIFYFGKENDAKTIVRYLTVIYSVFYLVYIYMNFKFTKIGE